MRDQNASALLASVMGWTQQDPIVQNIPVLQLLANYKYDSYQNFAPGRRFVESLALWLQQIEIGDRELALKLVLNELVFVAESEIAHLVRMAYPDIIVRECLRLVGEELDIPPHRVGKISRHPRFSELRHKTLYLGLSDGARTSELRRAGGGDISNEQIWQAYELGDEKAEDMLVELGKSLAKGGFNSTAPAFNAIWLLDDFSGSGNSYIRYDSKEHKFKGKIKKVYERLHESGLIDKSHYEVFLLLYMTTRQALDHLEYWSERFTAENNFKPLQIRPVTIIEPAIALTGPKQEQYNALLSNPKYVDTRAADRHFLVGGTTNPNLGFAGCALPVVLNHNTPNNSIYLLWGPDMYKPVGLFPRVSRHREF